MSFLIPAIAGGASLLSSIFGSKAQNKAAQTQADLYNQWLRQYQQTGQNLMGQATGQGWNPYGPKVSTSTGTTSQQGGSSYSNRPFITKEYAPLDELMRGIMQGRLGGETSLPEGYATTAAQAINESYAGADQAARNLAARRGLSPEQTYAVASPASRERAGALASMRSNLPLLERQLRNEDIAITQGLQSAFGRGEKGTTSTWGTSQSQGQQTSPFTASDLGALMNVLMPPGPQQSGLTGQSTVGAGIDSLGALLGFLASQQKGGTANPAANAASAWWLGPK